MKYDDYELDDMECPDVEPSNSVKPVVDEITQIFEDSMKGKTIKNLEDLAKIAKETCNDSLDNIVNLVPTPTPEEESKDTFSTELKAPSTLRELIEQSKTSLCSYQADNFKLDTDCVDLNDKELLDSFGKPGVVRDPVESSNNYEVFELPENSELVNSAELCLDEDSKESQERILKDTQSHLGRQLVQAIDMSVLDDIQKSTYVLEGELAKLGKVKQDKALSIDKSIEQAEKLLTSERRSIVISSLEGVLNYVPENFHNLVADEQKAFRDASSVLNRALNLYKKADVNVEDPASIAIDSIIQATKLWPKYNEDPRIKQLLEKVLLVEGVEKVDDIEYS